MRKLIGKLLIATIFILSISGCTQKQTLKKQNLGFTAPGMSDKESMVVFYRKNGDKAQVPTVWVGNRMVGTLASNQYTQTWVCPDRINVRLDNNLNTEGEYSFMASKGEVLYFEIYQPTSGGAFAIKKTDKMSSDIVDHSDTINRYKPYCNSEYIELDADMLFAFNKSELSPDGINSINALMSKIKKEYFSVKKIHIVGYTDRIGTNEYNDKLSLARAEAVAKQLRANGVGVFVDAMGMGERSPITRNCKGEQATPELIQCLAPDRRVGVEIIGVENTIR